MMTDAPTGHFQSIVLQPHAGQFFIDELPAIVLCCAAWVYGGMEGLPLTALAVPGRHLALFGIAVPFHLSAPDTLPYRLRAAYQPAWGAVPEDGLHGAIPHRGLCGTPKPHATALRIEDGTHLLDGQEYTPA